MKSNAVKQTVHTVLFFFSLSLIMASCGRAKTEKLLLDKKWEVYNVTPPGSGFNIEQANRAEELKNGFYKNAWFRFLPDSVFITSFNGKIDSGKYHIGSGGKIIALYPKYGGKMYEQIQIQQLTRDRLSFNTVIADFRLVLHLKAATKDKGNDER